MTKNEFSSLTAEYCKRFKEDTLKLSKKEVMGRCMEIVMAEEADAVSERAALRDTDEWYPGSFLIAPLVEALKGLKTGEYTYEVFQGMLAYLAEPNDDGHYDIFVADNKYNELADALAWAVNDCKE